MAETVPPRAEACLDGGGDMGELMRATDWSATPLGPVASWPQSLRTTVSTCLGSRFPILIWWGRDLVKLYNDAYRQILGDKHPRSLGRAGREVWPEIWPVIGPMLDGVMTSGEATWSENLMLPLVRHGFAEECYFTFSYSPIRDESGGVGGIFCAVTETTRQVIDERRLRLLRELTLRAGDAEHVDAACEAVVGAVCNDVADAAYVALYLFDARGELLRRVACCDARDGAPRFAPMVTPDELVRPTDAVVLPVHRPGHERPYGLLVLGISPHLAFDDRYRAFFELVADHVARAISNAVAHEEERARAESLAQLNRAKSTFFANVSHEFRTPLTLLLGPSEEALAERAALPPRQAERIEIIHRNALRLSKLVNTMLDFSRIEAGRLEATYVPTDLAACTRELASAFQPIVERAGLRFTVTTAELPEPVHVDRNLWERIVFNLLSNAFKFTFEGEIAVELRDRGDGVDLAVRDTGAGIAPEELPRIFERFHRVANVRTRTHEGLGIGLAFVNELARLHGGALGVTSAPGAGSTFTVSIPYGTAHLPQDRLGVAPRAHIAGPAYLEEAESWLDEAASEPSGEVVTLDDATVLVVDDNADMCSYLRRVLGTRFRVHTAADGAAALAFIKMSPPDVVVSDVMMPGLDGFELIAALAADERTRDVPVILLSARAGEDERSVGLEAGAADYLVKPFAARELIARVNTQLALVRMRRLAEVERVQLEEASRAKDEFLAMLGHELRNPLAPIATAAELLKLRHQGPPSKQLTIIERQVEHLIRLVDDLLDVSRITRGLIELRRGHVDVRAAVGRAIETARTLFDQRHHQLDVSTAMSPMTVMGDEARLVQVLSNLLTNAARYTPPGGHIRVRARPDGEDVVITVTDNGAGIAPELLPRIFDMFVQGKRGADRSEGGLGLGLALVRTLVHLHGGSVSAHSDGPGRGAELRVRLPAAPRSVAADDDATDLGGARWSVASRGHRVLIVDDNHDAVETLAELLRVTGHEVAVAFDGLEALEVADRFAPTVAILDLGLPIMDGFELARHLRARNGGAPLWLAAVTGYGQDQDRARTREAGFDLHLVKPIELDALITALEAVELSSPRSSAAG